MPATGRSMVAGNQRSQTLARAYTNTAVDHIRQIQSHDPAIDQGHRIFQHVDDLTELLWHTDFNGIYEWASGAAKAWVRYDHRIGMAISEKTVILPKGVPATCVKAAL